MPNLAVDLMPVRGDSGEATLVGLTCLAMLTDFVSHLDSRVFENHDWDLSTCV